jgi:hypothetical protein
MATSQRCCHLPGEMLNSATECADRARIVMPHGPMQAIRCGNTFAFAIAIFVFQLQCNCSACDVPPDAGLHKKPLIVGLAGDQTRATCVARAAAQTNQPSTTTQLRGQFFNHNCVLFGVVKVYQTFSICDPGPRSALRPHAPTSVLTSVIAGYYTHKWSLVQQCLPSITPTSGDLICHSGLYIGYPTIRPLSFRSRSFCPGHFVPVTSSPVHFVPSHFVPWSSRPLVISSPLFTSFTSIPHVSKNL